MGMRRGLRIPIFLNASLYNKSKVIFSGFYINVKKRHKQENLLNFKGWG